MSMKKSKSIDLTSGPILKTLSELALPIMASSLLGTAYNITDMAWIGLLGSKAVAGERESGMICLNGAAARQVCVGDKIIIMCYADMTPEEVQTHKPKVVFVDEENKISRLTNYEKHGRLEDM